MAYTNLTPNLSDYFATINNRLRLLETGPNYAATTADTASTQATTAMAQAVNAEAQAVQAEAQAVQSLAQATVAYNAAVQSLQPSANTIVNASNQITGINGNGITIYSGTSSSYGARVVLNSLGMVGYNSSGSATFTLSASDGSLNLVGPSITSGTIYGGSLNIAGNFTVNSSGTLYATGATIIGNITATSGTFTGTVYASAGSFTGAVTATSGSFTGSIYAGSGTIAGFTINSTELYTSGGMTIASTGAITTPGSINATGTIQAGGEISNTAGGAVFNGGLNVATGSATIAGNLMVQTMSSTAATTVVWSSSNSRFYLSSSSERFKTNINPVPNADYLSLLLKLEPVTFNYLPEYTDNPTLLVSGLIAEKVAEIPEFNTVVNYDKNNLPESIAYDRLAVFILPALQQLNTRLAKLEGANGTTTSA